MNNLDIVVAFGGDIFGAAVGVLTAFEFVGLLVIAMMVVQIITGVSSNFITLPFELFGPHTGGFAAGAAATVYAVKKGRSGSGRDITAGLSGLAAYDVLLVGRAFGAAGYIIAWGLNQIPAFLLDNAWTDIVALTVMISGVVSRLVFGKTGPFGKPEQGTRHCYPPQDKRWTPYHSRIPQPLVPGLGIGSVAGFLGLKFDSNGTLLAFDIFAFSLIFLHSNTQVPVSHRILLPVALVAAPSGSLIWAAIVGIVCTMLGKLMSRIFLIHGDTHIDPPAVVIIVMTTMISLSATIGLFTLVPLF